MASNELNTPDQLGVTDGGNRGADEASRGNQDIRRRTEQADQLHDGQGSQVRGRTFAETRAREEYSDSIRSQGPPVPDTDDSRHDNARAGAGERLPARTDDGGVANDRAESLDKDTYANHIRAGKEDSAPDGSASDCDRDWASPGTTSVADSGGSGVEVPEPQSHGSYADSVDLYTSAEESASPLAPDRPGGPGGITHYHGEFKGQALDLYTDGARWATGSREEGVEIVGQQPDRSPDGSGCGQPPAGINCSTARAMTPPESTASGMSCTGTAMMLKRPLSGTATWCTMCSSGHQQVVTMSARSTTCMCRSHRTMELMRAALPRPPWLWGW